MRRRDHDLQTIRSEGGLLPPDLLRRVIDPKANLEGTRPEDYGLPQGERLNEVITQSWSRLRKHWMEFRSAAERLPENEPGTGLTNDKWSLPLLRELGFGLLPTTAGPEIAGRTYAINRFFGPMPVHLVGCGLSLDRRAAGVRGAAAANPHGLVQEFINRSSGHLWAVVSNGLRLRILRDNQALSRQSFLEFDLEGMFAGEAYSDFVLLWLTAHATRFAPREGDRPESCWLEHWTKVAEEQGTRALGDLRGGVEKALQILGEGFTSHPRNTALRERLRTGQVPLADFHGQLLRVVYRLIFLFVAEDRTINGQPLLHHHDDSDIARSARERFADHYSTGRLRELAAKIKGSRHADLWQQFRVLVGALSGDEAYSSAREHLALPTLGSFLWHLTSTTALNDAELTNHDFLEALRHLAFTRQGKVLRPVDYKNLGAEELGGVYESLLALTPQVNADGSRFTFAEFAGNERKTSGSYYTPDSLVQCLLDSALDPVVEEAIKGKSGVEAERAILSLKVCDPAVGSGHFLVGAAHRLARHLARVRALAHGESEPSPLLYQHALRDVIGRCLYGVDINPMAAELCRVSLWLEALEPGKPLSFLDHHIRVGNSLLGTTPELITAGLPDEAFTSLDGDDKKACAVLKKRNKAERNGLGPLFSEQEASTQVLLQQAAAALGELPDDRPEDIRIKELAFRHHEQTEEYRQKKQLADAWCAAFVIRKHFREPGRETSASGITSGHLNGLAAGRRLPDDLAAEAAGLSRQYQFFHWHLAFPEVFTRSGFDCVLGNPPWETIKLQDKEWFANRRPGVSEAPNAAARDRLIALLEQEEPLLYAEYVNARRLAAGSAHLVSSCGAYPLCSSGDLNTFALFAELARRLTSELGRIGCVLPTGIVTDDPYKGFFQDVLSTKALISVFDFENQKPHFPAVKRTTKFCLFTSFGKNSSAMWQVPQFLFFGYDTPDLDDDERCFELSAETIARVNPNTKTCPVFRSRRDAILTGSVHNRHGVLVREGESNGNLWNVDLTTLFHMSGDSDLFRFFDQVDGREKLPVGSWLMTDGERWAPLFEQNLFHMYDHRFASYGRLTGAPSSTESEYVSDENHRRPDVFAVPRYWLRESELKERWEQKGLARAWSLAFRQSARTVDSRTGIFCVLPKVASGHSVHLSEIGLEDGQMSCARLAEWNSFAWDYLFRQSLGGNNTSFFVVKQVAAIEPSAIQTKSLWSPFSNLGWLASRVVELTYTAWDLEPFAYECGWPGPPFRWDEERRFLLRCELDAALFHLYLSADVSGDWGHAAGETAEDLARLKACFNTARDAVAYIMDTFPIVRRKDEEKHNGDYHTKRVILEIYDAMQEAIRTGVPYHTRLDPPPADPACRHPKKALGILAFGSLVADPGPELEPKIAMRITTTTDFPVEYGRYSGKTRGGAPTLVPHEAGAPVRGEILVLNDVVTVAEATDVLWRRERRKYGSGETYAEGTSANSVVVRHIGDSPCVSNVLYTDFHAAGKIERPDAAELAARAIESVRAAEDGKDGISYLMSNLAAGIETPLTPAYRAEILRQTKTESLEEALTQVKSART